MFENSIYNPDVLNCLANLSNDEVFTPPTVVNQMLDMLPQELFRSSKTRFLDPVSKSGVFLREIAKRLIEGLAEEIPDLQERVNHICQHQLFGLAITELTSLLSRRSVYCSKSANGKYASCTCFNDPQGNIRYRDMEHTFERGKCKYCGASEDVFGKKVRGNLESHAYEFIHTDKPEKLFPKNMKFDVIIGNPPYQLDDGGNSASAKPLYHLFVEQAKKLNPRYLCMITPARWYAGGKGLEEYRATMLEDNKIKYLCDYSNSADCFPGVNIAGGVCYFLWAKEYQGKCEVMNMKDGDVVSRSIRNLNEYPVFVRDNKSILIIRKVLSDNSKTMASQVYSRNSFNLPSNQEGMKNRHSNEIMMLSSKGLLYIDRSIITDKENILKKYKTIITYAMSGGNKPSSNGDYQIISTLKVLQPEEVCTETFLVLGVYDNEQEALNLCSYVKTRFFRFLLLQALTSIHITKSTFQFVPLQDFSHPWTDAMLYEKYGLTEDEIAFIESMIRPME